MTEMTYRRLGRSGLKVSVLSFGSWVTFGDQVDTELAKECLGAARDAGVNFFDNAEAYAGGREHAYYGLKPAHFTALLEQEYPALRGTSPSPSPPLHPPAANSPTHPHADATYLDHAASPPAPPLSLLTALPRALAHTLLSNPHSLHSPSAASTASRIAAARARLLATLFALPPAQHPEWLLVFTAGATAGCRLVAEAFDWRGGEDEHVALIDLNNADLHPLEHPERGHQGVSLIGVPPHLPEADTGDLERQQRGSDQARVPQTLGDVRAVRLAKEQGAESGSIDDLSGHRDPCESW